MVIIRRINQDTAIGSCLSVSEWECSVLWFPFRTNFHSLCQVSKKLQQKQEAHGLKMGLHSPVGDVLLALSMFCSAFGVDHRIILHIWPEKVIYNWKYLYC